MRSKSNESLAADFLGKSQSDVPRTPQLKGGPHIFEMAINTDPPEVLLAPEAAEAIREQLGDEDRAAFDAALKVFEVDGVKVLGLSRLR